MDVLALDRIGDDLVRKTKIAGRLLINSVKGDEVRTRRFKRLAKLELKKARTTYNAKWQNLWFSVPVNGKTNAVLGNCTPTCVLQNNQPLKADLTSASVSIAGNADKLLRRIPKNAARKFRKKAKNQAAQLVALIDSYKKFLSDFPDVSCKS